MGEITVGSWAVNPLIGMIRRCEHSDTVKITEHIIQDDLVIRVDATWSDGSSAVGLVSREEAGAWTWEIKNYVQV